MANQAKEISKYALAIGAGALIGSASLSLAAPGDAIYRTETEQVCITPQQAACHADCAIADGAWDGNRANMQSVKVYRTGRCDAGFATVVTGTKTAALVDVPPGSIVDGVVE